ncbi:MAG: efflux transporter outer membrane subunit [Rhodospirillaceae bacterium]|nr:efflux transporter outer membrane subunit [Rhodospirillaceae bacterium]
MPPVLRRTAPGALVLAVVLAGCAAPPVEERPAVPVPAAWSQPAPARPGAVYPQPGWWRAFGSAELERLVAAAQRNNPDLEAAGERIAQAMAQARAARAGLFPSLQGSVDVSRSLRSGRAPLDDIALDLDVAYEVDLWGKNRMIARAADETTAASVYDRQAAALSLVAAVATTYFRILSLDDRLASAREILAIAEQILTLVEDQARIGVVSDLEVTEQRSAVATLRAQVPALARQRQESLDALAALLGTTPGALHIEAGTLAGIVVPAVAAGLPAPPPARRPDLRRAEAALAAARADAAAARAALFPTISLTAGGGTASDALQALFTPESLSAAVAASLLAPIFDAGRLAGQHQQAEARARELVAAYRSAVITAFREVEDALAAVRYLAEADRAQRDAAAQARRAYDLAAVRYRAGLVDFLTVLNAQTVVFQQQDALAQTELARLTAAVDLFKALGGGW